MENLDFFKLLIGVSGIGPKSAMNILTIVGVEVLVSAITSGDISYLTKVSGIGKKNAQKIIIELRSKLTGVTGALPEDTDSETRELADALVSMGFDRKKIRDVIRKLPEGTLEVKIRHALKMLG